MFEPERERLHGMSDMAQSHAERPDLAASR